MSDILIKNMELPKEGGLVIEITKHGQVAQLFKDGSLLRKDIKAIELSPHGRLKDIDAIISDLPKTEFSSLVKMAIEVTLLAAPTVLGAST